MSGTRRWIGAVAVVAIVIAASYVLRGTVVRFASALRSSPAPAPVTVPVSGEPAPGMAAPASTSRGEITIDPRRQQLIGVRTVAVTSGPLDQAIRAAGTVRYDETRQTDVNVKVEGWIRDLSVDYTGQFVQKGQPLFTLYSPDLVSTQQEYLLALASRDRLQQSAIPELLERADGLVAAARQRLARWDLSADDLRNLDEKRQVVEAITFRAPSGGFVVEKQAIAGLHVMPGQSLYKIADLSTVWVEADVYESELSAVRLGDAAAVTIDAYPGQRFTGRVIYVYPYLDEKTRTNKVRFELPNPDGRLKPGMFVSAELTSRAASGVTVPNDAVLDSGAEQIAFVALGDGRFEPRKVTIGRRIDDRIQILTGLKEGEQVATGAAFFLDSESQLHAALQGYEAATPQAATPGAAAQVDISVHAPADPKMGDNAFEVVVRDAEGKSIDDAEVTLQFFMPAMPTMNMPAMRNEAQLAPAGNGVYRGTGQVRMAGHWDLTVSVTRNGRRLGSKQLPLVAR